MSQALYTSMTGLNVAQQSINVVSNNVANINTTAFKSADARFATLFSNTLTAGNAPSATAGGTNPKQIGLGVKLEAITRNFIIGSYLSTGNSDDSMISGRGYYTVMDPSGNVFLTRDGGFTLDANGDMITASGNKVLGAARLTSEEASQVPIHVPRAITTTVSGADLTTKTLGELNNAEFTAGKLDMNVTSGGELAKIQIEITQDMIDDAQSVNELCAKINDKIKDAIANTNCDATGAPLADPPTVTFTPGTDGTIKYKITGGTDSTADMQATSTANFAKVLSLDTVKLSDMATNPDGISSKTLSYVVQVDPEASPETRTSLSGYTIGADGTIEASYDNGDKLTVVLNDTTHAFEFQYVTASGVYILGDDVTMNPNVCSESSLVMQIATVTNEAGLVSQASNLWTIGPDTGDVSYTVAGQMGTGKIVTGGLEGSNVDLARELSNMILAQRAINANSRVFGTASSVLETLSQLGR